MKLHRRVQRLEIAHGNLLDRCGTCGGYDPMNPPMAITRHDRPLEQCPECGLVTDDGQPLPPHYKRIVLPDGGEGI
jgi:hypothetical protein